MTAGLKMDGEKWAATSILSMPDERTLAQTHDDVRAVLERWQTPSETTFGFCIRLAPARVILDLLALDAPIWFPPLPNALLSTNGERHLPSGLENWKRVSTEDAFQATLRVQELDNLIRTMGVMQPAIDDGTSTPP